MVVSWQVAGWGRWPGGPGWLGRGEGEERSLSCHESLLGKECWGNFPGGLCRMNLPWGVQVMAPTISSSLLGSG